MKSGQVNVLELGVQPRRDDRDRTAVAVVSGIDDELIIEGDAPEGHRETVIGLKDLLGAWMQKLAVADQDAETSVIEKRLVVLRSLVDDAGNPPSIVGSSPLLSLH